MINEWIRNNKKLALILSVGALALLALIIFLIVNVFQNSSREEQDPVSYISISNIEVLYEEFSDYTIGYISNALMTAVSSNQSMKSGKAAADNADIPKTATNQELYSGNGTGEYVLNVEDGKIEYFEDEWGMWNTFTVSLDDGRRFKVDVAIGAHNRDNDVSYTKINITKL